MVCSNNNDKGQKDITIVTSLLNTANAPVLKFRVCSIETGLAAQTFNRIHICRWKSCQKCQKLSA